MQLAPCHIGERGNYVFDDPLNAPEISYALGPTDLNLFFERSEKFSIPQQAQSWIARTIIPLSNRQIHIQEFTQLSPAIFRFEDLNFVRTSVPDFMTFELFMLINGVMIINLQIDYADHVEDYCAMARWYIDRTEPPVVITGNGLGGEPFVSQPQIENLQLNLDQPSSPNLANPVAVGRGCQMSFQELQKTPYGLLILFILVVLALYSLTKDDRVFSFRRPNL